MSAPSIVEIVETYRHQYVQDARQTDRSMLEKGKSVLYDQIEQASWDSEMVHRGMELLYWLGDKTEIVKLLQKYLLRPLSIQEEAWARWHLTDNLATLGKNKKAVESQKSYLHWAMRVLPQPEWMVSADWLWDFLPWRTKREDVPADEGLLFEIMSDGTQAQCWFKTGQSDAWLEIYHNLMKDIAPTSRNRFMRRYYVRSEIIVLGWCQKLQEALLEVDNLDQISREDPGWSEAFETWGDSRCVEMDAYGRMNEISQVRQIAKSTTSRLEEQFEVRDNLTAEERQVLWGLYHNAAAPIYRAKQYDLAIPLFQRAIELGIRSEYSYLWLAASIWATERDRDKVLSLLKRGVFFSRFGQHRISKAPEFSDIADDPEFCTAIKRP
ncbi:MAG: hypothetical protein OXI23_05700 [Gemmatimonadota bacterium]|nr:hypothetical protein [Gemmatimonadota bacterium]